MIRLSRRMHRWAARELRSCSSGSSPTPAIDSFRSPEVRDAVVHNFSVSRPASDGASTCWTLDPRQHLGARRRDRCPGRRSCGSSRRGRQAPARQREAFLLRFWQELDVARQPPPSAVRRAASGRHCSRAVGTPWPRPSGRRDRNMTRPTRIQGLADREAVDRVREKYRRPPERARRDVRPGDRRAAALRAREGARRRPPGPFGVSVLSAGDGTAILGFSRSRWWQKIASVLPVAALIGGLLLIEDWQTRSQISVAAEVDAALLGDDLPINAYSDPGFLEFLKTPAGRIRQPAMTPGLVPRLAAPALTALVWSRAPRPCPAPAPSPTGPVRRLSSPPPPARPASLASLTPAQRQALTPFRARLSSGIDARRGEVAADRRPLPSLPPRAGPGRRRMDSGTASLGPARRGALPLPGVAATGTRPLGQVARNTQSLPPEIQRQHSPDHAAAISAPVEPDPSGLRGGPSDAMRAAKADVVPNPTWRSSPSPSRRPSCSVRRARPRSLVARLPRHRAPAVGYCRGRGDARFVDRSHPVPNADRGRCRVDGARRRTTAAEPKQPADPKPAGTSSPPPGGSVDADRPCPADPSLRAGDLLRLRVDAAVRYRPAAGGTRHLVLRRTGRAIAARAEGVVRTSRSCVSDLYCVGCWSVRGQTLAVQTCRASASCAAEKARGSASTQALAPLRRLLHGLVGRPPWSLRCFARGPGRRWRRCSRHRPLRACWPWPRPGGQFWRDIVCGTRCVDTRAEQAPARDLAPAWPLSGPRPRPR